MLAIEDLEELTYVLEERRGGGGDRGASEKLTRCQMGVRGWEGWRGFTRLPGKNYGQPRRDKQEAGADSSL